MLIKDILVGERRREEMGDVIALANSIQQYGLLQPVVIDAAMNLVAGERRLLACKALEWKSIEVRQLGELSTQELRLLELEENIRRKNLTSYEMNKTIGEYVAAVKEELEAEAADKELRPESGQNQKQAGRPSQAASTRKVAARTGIPRQTAEKAQFHVETADAFPFMQSWPQYQVLEAREQVAGIPVAEYPRITTLLDQPSIPPTEGVSILRNLATKLQEEREGIYALNESNDSSQRQQALTDAAAPKPPTPEDNPRLSHLRQAMKELAEVSKLSKDDLKDSVDNEIDHLISLEAKMKEPFALRLSKHVESRKGTFWSKVTHKTPSI